MIDGDALHLSIVVGEMNDDFRYTGFEFLQRVRVELAPVLRCNCRSNIQDPIDVDIIGIQRQRHVIRSSRPRLRYSHRQLLSACDAQEHFKQLFVLIERAHVRVEMRRLNAECSGAFDLRVDFEFDLLRICTSRRVAFRQLKITILIEQ
jgi:hypothetical protein